MADEEMDVTEVVSLLNEALRLQHRSTLQMSLASGGMVGLAGQALAPQLGRFAEQELLETRLIVEKITGLGGDPTPEVAPLEWRENPQDMIAVLARQEEETIAALHAVIPATGQQPRSEALEHLMEHLIMRKQGQLDLLLRIQRGA